jgi:8-oxo-dGTP diphosphatase
MDIPRIKIGCEVFLKQGDTILLGKRKNCYGEGTWAVPGGHLEYGEMLIEAAQREMKEELGIDVFDITLLTVTENISKENHYIHCSFLAEKYNGAIQCMEPDRCHEWKFFPLHELPKPLFKPHEKILKTYFKNIFYLGKETSKG